VRRKLAKAAGGVKKNAASVAFFTRAASGGALVGHRRVTVDDLSSLGRPLRR
jgi:hypothetical protein